jgi:hypothetical protein
MAATASQWKGRPTEPIPQNLRHPICSESGRLDAVSKPWQFGLGRLTSRADSVLSKYPRNASPNSNTNRDSTRRSCPIEDY